MKRLLLILTGIVVAGLSALAPAAPAMAAWDDLMPQSQMIKDWCRFHEHKALGWGNWQDGYWCQQPGYNAVRQTTVPGDMCKWLLRDDTVRFHIYPGTKNGACARWY